MSRAVRDTVTAAEGPREGHQGDGGHDALLAAVPTENIQGRDVVLRLVLAANLQQIAAGCTGRPTRHVAPAHSPSACAILLPTELRPDQS